MIFSNFSAAIRRGALLALAPLVLVACNHEQHAPGVRVELPTLATGAHTIVVDGDPDAHDGIAFVGSDGAAYVVLGKDSNAAASVVYRRSGGSGAWQRVPQTGDDLQLRSALDEPQSIAAWVLPSVATTYRARLGDSTVAFTLAPDGKVSAGGDGCSLAGTLGSADLANAARAALTFSGCAHDGNYDGIAYVDPDAPNAAFHLIVDDGTAIRDFYAFAP